MKTNIAVKRAPVFTHEGAKASHINYEQQLRRSVMSCLLWEDSFYEDGQEISKRIADLVPKVKHLKVSQMAIEAREKMKLRHVPLFLVREMARHKEHKGYVAETLSRVIQRADELSEFVSIYWKEKKQPLSKQVKLGLAKAFRKFNEYALAKYNRDGAVKLRDVLFLCHAKPENSEQEALWKRLIDGKLTTPDTWEVELSASKDKKASWTRLLDENKLGALALLRNLRNMREADVDQNLVNIKLDSMKTDRVLPFRFIAASKHAPNLEPSLERAMFRSIESQEKLTGKTILVIDTSGSMHSGNVSRKSDLTRVEAATALAILIREVCENPVIYATAGSDGLRVHATKEVPSRRGFALSDAIWGPHMRHSIGHGGIFLTQCMDFLKQKEKTADRIIVITDEQDCDFKCKPDSADAFGKQNYIINVSIEKNGIGYGKFTHINGWSEAIVQYIQEAERAQTQNSPSEDQ
jgi:60 kDa SS-A/Ro ribonucleoprotein